MKKIYLLIIGVLFFLGIDNTYALDKNLVNIYLFYSETCPHCEQEQKMLNELDDMYDNIKIYKYEVSKNGDNYKLLTEVANLMDENINGVPFTVIGDKVYKGFNYEFSKRKFMATIEYYSDNGYVDRVGEHIGGIELPKYEVIETDEEDSNNVDEFIDKYDDKNISIFGYNISLKKLSLPIVSVLLGLLDGFNPCAMWVLLFLISILIGINDKKRMWTLGLVFLLSSSFIYLLFMIAWLSATSYLKNYLIVRNILGVIALCGGLYNIYSYYKNRNKNGCSVVKNNDRNKIFSRIRKFTSEKNMILAIIGIVLVAVSVNVIELACSAGIPVMFIEILTINNITLFEKIVYIFLYMIFFMIDDFIVFFISVITMSMTSFSTKFSKYSKILGGGILVIIGILLIFKPEWLMFNF